MRGRKLPLSRVTHGDNANVRVIMAAIQFTGEQTEIQHELPCLGNVGQTCTTRIILLLARRYDLNKYVHGHRSE